MKGLAPCVVFFTAVALDDGTYSISSKSSSLQLQANDLGDHLVSTRFQSDDDYARFKVSAVDSGTFRLSVVADDRVLHADDLGSFQVATVDYEDDYAHFKISEASGGGYTVKTAPSGRSWSLNNEGLLETISKGKGDVFTFTRASPGPSPTPTPENAPAIAWTNGYNNGGGCEAHPHKVVETSDGGFLMVGDSMCWDGSSSAERVIFVVKTDSSGKQQWSSRHGDVHYNYGKGGLELDDGTFVVVGAISKAASSENSKTYIEHRALIRLSESGETLTTTLFANDRASEGLLDGLMCVDSAESGAVVVTGYKGSVNEFDDNPMFLIFGGQAFVMKLRFESRDTDPVVVFEVPLAGDDWNAVQGMRLGMDRVNGRIAVASVAVPQDDADAIQMSMFSVDASTGSVAWSRYLPAQNSLQSGVMSHPYALAVALDGSGYAIAGHAFPCLEEATCQPRGRLVKVSANGDLEWDSRFRHEAQDYNTECYGVTAAADGGFAVACGTGVEPEDHPDDPAEDKTWRSLVYKVDANGATEWQHLYTSNKDLQNNAAEDMFATRDGGYAVAIDSQSFGQAGTGGNFGLIRLEADNVAHGNSTSIYV